MRDGIKLAIAAGALALRLRRDEAVVGGLRAELIRVLVAVVTAAAGHPAPGRADANPGVLIDLLVGLCRSAGMSGAEMAARFNDAVERRG